MAARTLLRIGWVLLQILCYYIIFDFNLDSRIYRLKKAMNEVENDQSWKSSTSNIVFHVKEAKIVSNSHVEILNTNF